MGFSSIDSKCRSRASHLIIESECQSRACPLRHHWILPSICSLPMMARLAISILNSFLHDSCLVQRWTVSFDGIPISVVPEQGRETVAEFLTRLECIKRSCLSLLFPLHVLTCLVGVVVAYLETLSACGSHLARGTSKLSRFRQPYRTGKRTDREKVVPLLLIGKKSL